MLATLAAERSKRGLPPLTISTPHPELFQGAAGVARTLPLNWGLLGAAGRMGLPACNPFYTEALPIPDHEAPPTRHILAELCRRGGITGAVELRTYFSVTAEELAASEPYRGALVFQASGLSGSHGMRNKEWGADKMARVAAHFSGRQPTVQLGSPQDPLLPGCVDLRGKTSLRQTAAILANAAGFVGLIGFPMHLARAVNCPAVIVYGGRERPWQSGYSCNLNLATAPECSPCWRWQTCDFERRCLTEIAPAQVIAAVEEMLRRPRSALAVESATIE